MKHEFSEDPGPEESYSGLQKTLHALQTSVPKLVIDLESLKASALRQGATSTPIGYFESGEIDYLKHISLLRKYIAQLPDDIKSELQSFIPPLCVFLYHELRQRQSKEVYINFLAKIVDQKILPNANEVDKEEYFNTKHIVSLSRQTYDHLMDLLRQQEWLSVISVINQKFVFDIKKDSLPAAPDDKARTALQKACTNLELGLGTSTFSFIKTLKITNNSSILCMSLTPNNRSLLLSSTHCVIYRWELAPAGPAGSTQSEPRTPLPDPEIGLVSGHRFTVEPGESGCQYTELRGHTGPVYWVETHREGTNALSASHDGTVGLWDLTTNRLIYRYRGHSDYPVYHVTWSPVACYFVSSSHDTTARLWRTDVTGPLRVFAGHTAPVTRSAFHPNGSYVVTASEDLSCRLWDVSSGKCARVISHNSITTSLAVSPNGRLVASTLESGEVLIWDIATTKTLRRYATESAPRTNGYHADSSHRLLKNTLSHCLFLHENTLVTGDQHGNIALWDVRLHSKLHSRPVRQLRVAGRVRGISANKAGLLVVGVI